MKIILFTSESNEFENSTSNRSNLEFSGRFNKQVVSSKTTRDNTQTNIPYEDTSYIDPQALNNMTN